MFRIFLSVLATVSLGLLFMLADTVKQPLARLMRAVLAALVAVLTVTGLAIGVTGMVNEAWWATIIGGAILLVALRLGWALRGARRRGAAARGDEPDHVPLTRALPDPQWRQLERRLDWVGRQQLRRSQLAITAFVAEKDSPSLTPEQRSLLLSCEKRVPELIQTCVARCRNANAQERDRYVDETLATLNQIGGEAERARRDVREADDLRLKTLHRYFDNVAGGEGEAKRLP